MMRMIQPLTTSELLTVWERGRAQSPLQRTLLILAAAAPTMSRADLAALPLGQRDRWMLDVREWTFGSVMNSVATCPHCGERLQLTFATADVRTPSITLVAVDLALHVGEYTLQLRLPTSADLLAVISDGATARRLLVQRCILEGRCNGEPVILDALPPDVETAIVQRLADADPQADVQLQLHCPACTGHWLAAFDIGAFFWHELETWAARIIGEVHILAATYGWSEAAILDLSPWRRRLYLERIGR